MENKIGLKIVRASGGFSLGLGINEDQQWLKSVRDTREDCKFVPGILSASGALVTMYSAVESGEFYTQIAKIEGRSGDYLAAWIYIPSNIEIKGEELDKILEATKKEMLSSQVNEGVLADLFSREYPVQNVPKLVVPTSGQGYAVRYYGKGCGCVYSSIAELFDADLSQTGNDRYKAIFLINKNTGIMAENCRDLSNDILKKSITISAPEPKDGFTPYIGTKLFDKAIRVKEGENLTITWKKIGYRPIEKAVIAHGDTTIPQIDCHEYEKEVSFNAISITDTNGRPVREKYSIMLGSYEMHEGDAVSIKEEIIKEVPIVVKCRGYQDFRGNVDFSNNFVRIQLKENIQSYKFQLQLWDGSDFAFDIESKTLLNRSPLVGYRLAGNKVPMRNGQKNYLEYKGETSDISKWLLPVIALVTGIIIGGLVMFGINKISSKCAAESQVSSQESRTGMGSTTSSDVQSGQKAKDYLDRNGELAEYEKSKMEQIPDLKGLWDEMNNYEFDKILKREGLKDSDNYKRLMRCIENYTRTAIEISESNSTKISGRFNNEGDEKITLKKYFEKIKKKTDELTSSAAKASTDGGKNQQYTPRTDGADDNVSPGPDMPATNGQTTGSTEADVSTSEDGDDLWSGQN